MTTDLQPPFFLFSDGLDAYGSLDGLLRTIEPVDVDDTTRAYDVNGREVVLRAVGVERGRFVVGGGEIEWSVGELAPADLAAGLRHHLTRVGVTSVGTEGRFDTAPLADLARAAADRFFVRPRGRR